MRSFHWVAVASLLTAGCGQSAKDLVDENRSQLEVRLRAIEQFAKKVESGEASDAELTFPDGTKLRSVSAVVDGNFLQMHVERALGSEPKFEFDSGEWVDFQQAKQVVAGEFLWDDPGTAKSSIGKLLGPRYLLLLKVDEVTLPKGSVAEETFIPGSVEFRVYGFDLNDMKNLDERIASRKASDEVSVRGKYFTDDQLKTDLAGNATLEVKKALSAYRN